MSTEVTVGKKKKKALKAQIENEVFLPFYSDQTSTLNQIILIFH